MKRIILLAVAAFVFTASTQAQIQRKSDTSRIMQMKENRHDMMSQLNLTKEQHQKVKELNQDNKSKVDAIRNDNSLTQDQKKEKMKELRKAHQEGMNSILTKDQQDKMKAYKKDHHRKNGKKMMKRKMDGKKGTQKTQAPVNS